MKPNLNIPSRNDVEICLQQLEIEDQREKQVIRNYWKLQRELERRKAKPRKDWPLIVLGATCLVLAGYLFVILWISL